MRKQNGWCNTKQYFNSYWVTWFIDLFTLIGGVILFLHLIAFGVKYGILK